MATRNSGNLVKLKDAINLVNQEVNLLGFVLHRSEPKQCRNYDWLCTLHIIDDSCPNSGLTVNVFTRKLEELPRLKYLNDMVLFTRVKMKAFDGSRVNAAFNKRCSSFSLYEEVADKGFVCYHCSSNFHGEAQYKSSIDELGKWFSSRRVDQGPYKFSFLREIKEGKCFNLLCRILHVNEDMNAFFVWDGTDASPTSTLEKGIQEKTFSSLPVHTLVSREALLGFPTVGTILKVFASKHFFHWVKPGKWMKLYDLLCEVERGSWVAKFTNSSKIRLAQDDRQVEKITRIYDKRISSKLGHIPFWSFPSPHGLTETDEDCAPFVTLMDIITFPKVTYKYRCIVRAIDANPFQVKDFCPNGMPRYRVLLTLEDPTTTIEAFLCDKDAEYFWDGFQNIEILRKKRNRLLGIKETDNGSENLRGPRNPPWIECCIMSYYTDKASPWETRFYRIFGTRLLV